MYLKRIDWASNNNKRNPGDHDDLRKRYNNMASSIVSRFSRFKSSYITKRTFRRIQRWLAYSLLLIQVSNFVTISKARRFVRHCCFTEELSTYFILNQKIPLGELFEFPISSSCYCDVPLSVFRRCVVVGYGKERPFL